METQAKKGPPMHTIEGFPWLLLCDNSSASQHYGLVWRQPEALDADGKPSFVTIHANKFYVFVATDGDYSPWIQ